MFLTEMFFDILCEIPWELLVFFSEILLDD